jgi:hypothetical protein
MPITEVPIRSLGALIDRITPAAPDQNTGRRRDTGVYHGTADASMPLVTSLGRLGGETPAHTKVDLEAHILRNFIRYSRPYFPQAPTSDWELLVAAEHHGVPTRLLDWTYSPLVAAFFATRMTDRRSFAPAPADPRQERDRAIWRLDWQAVHEAFKIPCLALRVEELSTVLGRDNLDTPWQLFDTHETEQPFACLIEPPSLDARIVAQASVFTLSSSVAESFDCFLTQHHLERALTKFVIPRDCVATIRDQLDLSSVDERRLFPDLDGVAAALRRYYM